MMLPELYNTVSPCVVAFISKMLPLPANQQPIFPRYSAQATSLTTAAWWQRTGTSWRFSIRLGGIPKQASS